MSLGKMNQTWKKVLPIVLMFCFCAVCSATEAENAGISMTRAFGYIKFILLGFAVIMSAVLGISGGLSYNNGDIQKAKTQFIGAIMILVLFSVAFYLGTKMGFTVETTSELIK